MCVERACARPAPPSPLSPSSRLPPLPSLSPPLTSSDTQQRWPAPPSPSPCSWPCLVREAAHTPTPQPWPQRTHACGGQGGNSARAGRDALHPPRGRAASRARRLATFALLYPAAHRPGRPLTPPPHPTMTLPLHHSVRHGGVRDVPVRGRGSHSRGRRISLDRPNRRRQKREKAGAPPAHHARRGRPGRPGPPVHADGGCLSAWGGGEGNERAGRPAAGWADRRRPPAAHWPSGRPRGACAPPSPRPPQKKNPIPPPPPPLTLPLSSSTHPHQFL